MLSAIKFNYGLPLLMYLAFLISFTGCSRLTDAGQSPAQLTDDNVFSTNESATSAVSGLYSQLGLLNLGILNGGMTVYTGLSADELYNTSSSATLDPFSSNTLVSTHSVLNSNFWTAAYKYIYHANLLLEGLQDPRLSTSVVKQLKGEVKVVRAFCYFNLVNLFGSVPLVTQSDYLTSALISRTPETDIYTWLQQELTEASTLLTENYPSSGKVRPNKFTAFALLARVQLYSKNWFQAEQAATQVIQSGFYTMPSTLNAVFLPSSSEAIWEISRDNANTAEGAAFVPSSATVKPTYAIRSELISAFEAGDKRRTEWIKLNTVSSQTSYYPVKYKVRVSSPVTEYLIAFRLSEQYLIRAEARLKQGNITGCQDDLNIIRLRAGIPLLTSINQSVLEAAVAQERRVELFAEWGHRWMDLKRTGKTDAVLSVIKPGWQNYSALYPIPFNELQRNPFLAQNPGY